MSLPLATAESIAEKLYDFNPNLDIKITPGDNEIVATIDMLKMCNEEFQALAQICDFKSVTISATGKKVKIFIY